MLKYLPKYLVVTTVITEEDEEVETVVAEYETRKKACQCITELNREYGRGKYRLKIDY